MVIIFIFSIFFSIIKLTFESQCTTINGKQGLWYTVGAQTFPCASTTKTSSNNEGACGCGTNSGGFSWKNLVYTAGGGSSLFGSGTWCGSGCGQCFKITPTGYSVNGNGATNLNSITILLADLCTGGDYCPSSSAQLNKYGYMSHFNLQDYYNNITALGWDNAEVYYESVGCPSSTSNFYNQCQCKGTNSTNTTIVTGKCVAISGKTGLWYTVNGSTYPCASTTRYWDSSMGACGCGNSNNQIFSWQSSIYTAAASPPIFDLTSTWCGMGCGQCFEITPTGYSAEGNGASKKATIKLLTIDLCPTAGNEKWCSSPNQYGYTAHFDLADQNMNGLITALNWDNPEVYFRNVTCPINIYSDWSQCQCFNKTNNYTGPGNVTLNGNIISTDEAKNLELSLILYFLIIFLLFN